MPSTLSSPRTDVRRANRQRAEQLQYRQTLSTRGPFMGIIPDLDPNELPMQAARNMLNLRARAAPGQHGELLMLPPGFAHADPDNPILDGGDPIIMLGQLARVSDSTTATPGARISEYDITPLALTAGGAAFGAPPADPARLYCIEPTTNDWTEIAYTALGGSPAAGGLCVDRDNTLGDAAGLPHMCTFAPGAPTVGGVVRSYTGNVTQPVAIICTNYDSVKIYPRGDTIANHLFYEDLTAVFGAGQFLARSCASWNDRVYFLNTSETGVRYGQRIRRTARGTANPDPAILGSGATDADEFGRDGLRLEPIGDMLAAYFEDGVMFIQRTGVATSPDATYVITKERGLLGTHAMCAIGGNEHFGIFNDGWWILNSSGEWREVGVATVGDIPRNKWSKYFYQTLDYDHRHRLFCYYNRDFNQVVIIRPRLGWADLAKTELWILDLKSDRVFIDEYDATVLAGFDLQTMEDVTYADFLGSAPPAAASPTTPGGYTYETYEDVSDGVAAGTFDVTYADIGARYALEGMVHGNTVGNVFAHDAALSTRDGAVVEWSWETGPRSSGATRFGLTADRIVVEYINNPGVSAEAVVFSGTTSASQPVILNMSLGDSNTVQSTRRYFRFTAPSMGLRISGSGPVMLRSWDFDLLSPEVESMRDAT